MKELNQDTSLHGVIGVEHDQSSHTSTPLLELKQLPCSDSSLLKIKCTKCSSGLKPPNQLSKEEGTENDICNDCALLAIGITTQSSNPQSEKHEPSVKRTTSKMLKLSLCSNCNIKKERSAFSKKGWKVKECKECYVKIRCQKCKSMLKQDMFCVHADGDKMKICFHCISMSTVSCMECKEKLPVADFVATKSSVDARRCKRCCQGDEPSDEDASRKQMIDQPINGGLQVCVECKEKLPVADFDDTQLYTPVDKRRCKKCCQGESSDEDVPQKQMIEQATDFAKEQEKQKDIRASNSAYCQLLSSPDPNQAANKMRQDLARKSLIEWKVLLSSDEDGRKRLRDNDGSDSEHPRKVMRQNRFINQSQDNKSSCHLRLSALMKKIHVLGFQTCALREKIEALFTSESEYKMKAVLSLKKRIDDFELHVFAMNEKLKKFDRDKNNECKRTTMKG